MDVLSRLYDPGAGAQRAWLPLSLRVVTPFALLFATAAAAILGGVGPSVITRPVAAAGCHGGLLAAAFAAAWGRSPGWKRPAWLLTALLFLASASTQLAPWGAAAYLLVPAALSALGWRRVELRRIGWRPARPLALLLGAGVGAFLGAHLLLSASRTFGYSTRLNPLGPLLAAVAYDAGANVLSSELFFRGVIFNFWHRRSGFWTGALISTAACLFRYLLDPALPRSLEVTIGALFYVTLLGLTACLLFAASGSVLPSLLAACVFFGAYRTLHLS